MGPVTNADFDRIAAALARLLATWWLQQARDTDIQPEGFTDDRVEIPAASERQAKAPAPTGAGEIRPEHHTRREMTS